MGQQQLLLIVLGVILVGVAVVLGIQYFSVGAEDGAKDELVSHALTLGANAQQWYKKPTAMGGGGNTFAGFGAELAKKPQLQTSTNGTYTVGTGTDESILVTGTPIIPSYLAKWKVEATVYVDSIVTAIVAP
jgi:hypothetical protein